MRIFAENQLTKNNETKLNFLQCCVSLITILRESDDEDKSNQYNIHRTWNYNFAATTAVQPLDTDTNASGTPRHAEILQLMRNKVSSIFVLIWIWNLHMNYAALIELGAKNNNKKRKGLGQQRDTGSLVFFRWDWKVKSNLTLRPILSRLAVVEGTPVTRPGSVIPICI